MLPEVGASELIVLAVVALIVIGPKDLPVVLRKLGKMLSKMRALAADFRSSFDEMARQSELDDLRKEVEALRSSKLDPLKTDLEAHFDEMQHSLNDSGDVMKPVLDPADEYQLPQMPEPIPEPQPEIAPTPSPAASPAAELAAETPAKPPPKPRAPRKPKPKPEAGA
jgi:sec-independent protein translocase protein TatB